jgi:hypothetical protein
MAIYMALISIMLRISSKSGGKLACRRDWLLHPLVVRRAAPSSLRMIIRSIVEAARGLDNEFLSGEETESVGEKCWARTLDCT